MGLAPNLANAWLALSDCLAVVKNEPTTASNLALALALETNPEGSVEARAAALEALLCRVCHTKTVSRVHYCVNTVSKTHEFCRHAAEDHREFVNRGRGCMAAVFQAGHG